jgi:hypothetical protein
MSNETTQPSKETAPKIDYDLAENGDITRTDKEGTVRVARYVADAKRVELVQEHAKFRPAVVRFLNAKEVAYDSIILEGDTPDKPVANIPPCPKPLMQFGDKTPAIVEWYRKYKPAEFKARYGIRGPGTVTKTSVQMTEDGPKKVPVQVDALIAERKTHLTEKVEAADGQAGEYADER